MKELWSPERVDLLKEFRSHAKKGSLGVDVSVMMIPDTVAASVYRIVTHNLSDVLHHEVVFSMGDFLEKQGVWGRYAVGVSEEVSPGFQYLLGALIGYEVVTRHLTGSGVKVPDFTPVEVEKHKSRAQWVFASDMWTDEEQLMTWIEEDIFDENSNDETQRFRHILEIAAPYIPERMWFELSSLSSTRKLNPVMLKSYFRGIYDGVVPFYDRRMQQLFM